MPKLPSSEDLSRPVSGRAGRPLASYDTTAVGRGVSNFGQGIQSLAGDLSVIADRRKNEVDQGQAFETQRRFLEFTAAQEDALNQAQQGAKPGAFGFMEDYTKTYQAKAKEFFASVPEALKGEYDSKLFAIEDRLGGKALTFERAARKGYYTNTVNDGLTKIENNLYANPDRFDENLWEGNRFIDAIPDDDVSPIEKEELRRAWRAKAQIASLNGMPPAQRLGALGGGAPTVKYTGTAVPKGAMANLVARAAQEAGVDPAIALGIVKIESDFDPNAKAGTSSAGGLYQFITGTANQYGLGNKFDAEANARAGARLTKDNIEGLRRDLGREPTPGEIYIAHFGGFGMAEKLGRASPNASAESLFSPEAVRANRSILAGKTAAQVRAWADRKMAAAMKEAAGVDVTVTGAGEIDPRFTDMPWQDREKIIGQTETEIRQQEADERVAAKFAVETATANAPSAIMNTGKYTGDMPTVEQFLAAYGEQATQKYKEFQQAIETAQTAHGMATMPAGEIKRIVEDAAPTSSGDDAALQQERYDVLAKAADATLKARDADPAGYARKAFPIVDAAWRNVEQEGGYRAAIAASVAAQQQLGVADVKPLPKLAADEAVSIYKDENARTEDRIASVVRVLAATDDAGQRRALFEQLVDAGLPDVTEGAVEAYLRGDEGAARRLFEAAMVDTSKLPGKIDATPAQIDEAVQNELFAEGSVGDIYYGISDGSADNLLRAQRDNALLTKAVNIRMRRGEELEAAVQGAAEDLFGKVQVVNESNAQIILPAGADADAVLSGLESILPDVRSAVTDALTLQGPVPTSDGTKAIMDATTANRVEDILATGYFRNAEGGYVYIDPYTGAAIPDAAGNPMIFKIPATAAPVDANGQPVPVAPPASGFSKTMRMENEARQKVFQ